MTDLLARLAAALDGRYQLDRELGRGGMATVFLARDLRHRRQVALKLLHPEAAYLLGVERFLREVETLAGLSHPHILPLFDSGDEAGLLWYSMPYVEDGSLRGLLSRAGRLPLEQAVALVGEVADGLAHAHARGIVHRDIKPENILLSGGHALVSDFGIARGPETEGTARLTRTGLAMGTPFYMSPEQASGDEVVDARTDVYSLGCVLFELLAGEPPHAGLGGRALIASRFLKPPPSLRERVGTVPSWIDAVVGSALATQAVNRYADAAAFGRALRSQGAEGASPVRPDRLPRPADESLTAYSGVPAARPASPDRVTVGRERELGDLRAAFARVAAGRGLLLSVSGEPGIGKTALVEDFLIELAESDDCRIGRGRCSERLAGTEAYLPILEALESLMESQGGDTGTRSLQKLAPSWYAEVAAPATGEGLPPRPQAPSQERLKRELLGYLQSLCRTKPVVLFLDDVHWADASTVDLLAYVGARLDGLALLLIATQRPSELVQTGSPFRALKMSLATHGRCEELTVGLLDSADIDAYLTRRFPAHAFPPALPGMILAKTEGNPLFLVEMLRQLCQRGTIARISGQWRLEGALDEIGRDIPTSVMSLIERMIHQLDEEDRRVLVAASAAGERFDSATMAEVLEVAPVDLEERLKHLEDVSGLIRRTGDADLPDRTPTVHYRFTHRLYQDALAGSLTPSRRALLSGALGTALERRYGGHAGEHAGELALLFENARQWERAIRYFIRAARHAALTFAHFEWETLCRRARALLRYLDPGAERDRFDLELSSALARCLTMLRGFAAAEVSDLFTHARVLAGRLGETRLPVTALVGLWEYCEVRGELESARTLAREILTLAEESRDVGLEVKAFDVLQDTLHYAGEFQPASDYAERAIQLYSPEHHAGLAQEFGSYDPGVACRSEGALSLWLLGHHERASRQSDAGCELARRLGHPFSVALSLAYRTWLDVYRQDHAAAAQHADDLRACCDENGFAFFRAESMILRGWADAAGTNPADGVAQIRRGIREYRSTGALLDMPLWSGLLADALAVAGELDQSRAAVEEGLALCERTGVRFWEAELLRLRGRLIAADGPASCGESADCLARAAECAHRQGARSLELRALTDLVRVSRVQGDLGRGRDELVRLCQWFASEPEPADVLAARRELARSSDSIP